MRRLFVAIDIPEELKRAIAKICTALPGARWVAGDQTHLTLRFIGEADETLFYRIREGLTEVFSEPFTLRIAKPGCFPPKGEPHVLWLGVSESAPLARLKAVIDKSLSGAGIAPESRPFSPHITIARLRGASRTLTSHFLEQNREFCLEPFLVTEFRLYSSSLTPAGALHTCEASYPLSKGD